MNIERHGISIQIERTDDNFILSMKAVGKLTHGDYEIITPMVDSALGDVKEPRVKVLFDITELKGWEARAAWDDFKFGLKHGKRFEKIAIYGNKGWQELAAKVGSWFISGEVKYFEEAEAASAWLNE